MNQIADLPEWSAQGPVIELSEERCWSLIAGAGVGRLGVSIDEQPEIFPVNYFADGHPRLPFGRRHQAPQLVVQSPCRLRSRLRRPTPQLERLPQRHRPWSWTART